jgi:DNA-binding MarR family transcriptional regulator
LIPLDKLVDITLTPVFLCTKRFRVKPGYRALIIKYLGLLLEKGPLTAGELSQLTGLTTGAVTGLIDRLENKKLVKREFDKSDRRKVIIVANAESAKNLLTPFFKDLQQKTTKLLSTYTDRELQIIEEYFRAATDVMTQVAQKLNAE